MEIYMEKEDIERVLESVETLDVLNNKYGKPHGGNPMGIFFAALECYRRRVKEGFGSKEKEERFSRCLTGN